MVIVILGRQPKIGLAELESLFGNDAIKQLGASAALIDVPSVNANMLGGVVKIALPLVEVDTTNWAKLTAQLRHQLPKLLLPAPKGKINIALSAYGLPVNTQQLFRTGLELKKTARALGRGVRVISPASGQTALSSAQTLHNNLTNQHHIELVLVRHGNKTWLARTTWVQNIDDYSRRDFGRPKRDTFVGMLPPKLAQQMINLATSQSPPQTVLDPFCGTGVVLQESLLAGYNVYGSDINSKMVDFSRENLEWLTKMYNLTDRHFTFEIGDAISHTWRARPFDTVVSEVYLGQPLSGLPSMQKIDEIVATCNTITAKFLTNIHGQLKTGSRHCLAVPAWRIGAQFRHLPMLDHLNNLGYNRVRFRQASDNDLIYHRADQVVGRELLVITVK